MITVNSVDYEVSEAKVIRTAERLHRLPHRAHVIETARQRIRGQDSANNLRGITHYGAILLCAGIDRA